MKEVIIGQNDAGQRLDKFIAKFAPQIPKSMMYKAIRNKRIKLNNKRCEISQKLVVGDVLQLYINDEFFEPRNVEMPFLNAPSDINIIYEDENILLTNKQAGLVVHDDESGGYDTLINRILHYLYKKGEYKPEEENSFVPALCNRIDRNTVGIVIAAKNAAALRVLNDKIKHREIDKHYLCIVHGAPEKIKGTLKGYLLKNPDTKQVQIFRDAHGDALPIMTKYKALQTKGRFTLMDVELITGRTHQIRAHLAFIGHPLLGDTKYGFNRDNKDTGYKHQALCAYKLKFSFKGDSEPLGYLNGKSFEITEIPFRDEFYAGKIK